MDFYLDTVLRLFLASALGGLIGYERESVQRPAGFRTHILVCVGSALVMITSLFIFNRYSVFTSLDPARLGAQVISGIGFLGAGTIIREGLSVRGLTTAASLWAVACIGIAAGVGFYMGAVLAAIIIYTTLLLLKKAEKNIAQRKRGKNETLYVRLSKKDGLMASVHGVFEKHGIALKSVEYLKENDGSERTLKITLAFRSTEERALAMDELFSIDGVSKVELV